MNNETEIENQREIRIRQCIMNIRKRKKQVLQREVKKRKAQ